MERSPSLLVRKMAKRLRLGKGMLKETALFVRFVRPDLSLPEIRTRGKSD